MAFGPIPLLMAMVGLIAFGVVLGIWYGFPFLLIALTIVLWGPLAALAFYTASESQGRLV